MTTYTRIALVLGVIVAAIGFFAILLKPQKVNKADWTKSYNITGDNPYDLSVFKGLLDQHYGEDQVITCQGFCQLPDGDASGHGYIFIGYEYYRDSTYITQLMDFARRGGQVMILTEYLEWQSEEYNMYSDIGIDSIHHLTLVGQGGTFDYSNTLYELDSTSYTIVYELLPADTSDHYDIDTSLTVGDSILVFTHLDHDHGHRVSIHTFSDIFSNISMKYGDGLAHFDYVMSDTFSSVMYHPEIYDSLEAYPHRANFLQVDTVLLDTQNNHYGGGQYDSFNPIQFVFANPSFKWAYLLLIIGSVSYIYFTSKRKQSYIPTLPTNDNTSLEFIDTLSELYRMKNEPSHMAKHLEDNLNQFIKRRYFLDTNTPDFIKRVSQKSKVAEEEIALLYQRVKAARNNKRFREEQLVNLNKSFEEFYNKCQ